MDSLEENILTGYMRDCRELEEYLAKASPEQLKAPSAGTQWTNEELLFHMVFGYMVVRTLLPLVRIVSHFPRSWGNVFAKALNAATAPFDVMNYWGSRAAALIYNRARMGHKLESTTRALAKCLDPETAPSLTRAMDFPTRWDPFFTLGTSRADVYAYPTRHFVFHARQLTLNPTGIPTL